MITVKCPACPKTYHIDDKFAGKKAKCKECGAIMDIPPLSAASAEQAPAAESNDTDLGQLAALEAAAKVTATAAPASATPPRAPGGATPRPISVPPSNPALYGAEPRGEPMAVIVLILAIISFIPLIGFITGLLALILGLIAIKKIDASNGMLRGRGKAQAGTIIGGIFMGLQVVAVPVLLLIGILLPALGAARRTANQMKNSSQLRGIHQSMVIYAQSNNSYLTGLDGDGVPHPDGAATGSSGGGETGAARFWVLLNGQFIPGTMLINPQDSMTPWISGPLNKNQFSYASLDMLSIHGSTGGRQSEWRDNANSQAILIGDRNIGASEADSAVQSVWTSSRGDWRGNLVWGDNRAGFEQSARGFTTRYQAVVTTNDNLFASTGLRGNVTDNSSNSGSNCLLTYN